MKTLKLKKNLKVGDRVRAKLLRVLVLEDQIVDQVEIPVIVTVSGIRETEDGIPALTFTVTETEGGERHD